MDIDVGELFTASFEKLFPAPQRASMLNAVRLHIRLNGERISTSFGVVEGREFRVARLYVGSRTGYLRIFFEMSDDKLMLWHISRDGG